jgi:chemotaxis protein MotA
MDKTTAGGLGVAWLLVIAAMASGVGLAAYVDIPSVMIVIGGTAAIVIASFEGPQLKSIGKSIGVAFQEVSFEDTPSLVEKIVLYAADIKKHGVMHIEQKVMSEQNAFFKEAFQLVVDGVNAELAETLLENKIDGINKRHTAMIGIFEKMGAVAGAMGMVGTLVGLVAMLANLEDPAAVGPAMAVALLTTLYGALVGNLFAGIMETKLSTKHNLEMAYMEIVTQSTVLLINDDSIGNIKMKLNSFLQEAPE